MPTNEFSCEVEEEQKKLFNDIFETMRRTVTHDKLGIFGFEIVEQEYEQSLSDQIGDLKKRIEKLENQDQSSSLICIANKKQIEMYA